MGNPVAHSKSPDIQHAFAAQTGQSLLYQRLLVETGEFDKALCDFKQAGGRGLNITVPFKLDAWRAMDQRTPRAELAGAVNTIWFDENGTIHGDNTDGIGLVRDLENNQVSISGSRLLMLGAGGAVRGVLGPLLDARPASITLCNRTHEKAVQLLSVFDAGDVLTAMPVSELAGRHFDLIINGTAASLANELIQLPDNIITPETHCYDMAYADSDTVFVQWAKEQGARQALDGLGMLVEQGAESFYIWRGIRPDTSPVIEQFKPALSRVSYTQK